jgi:hypothetical protein
LQSILLLVFTIYFCLTCNRFHRLFSPHFRSSVDEDTTPRDGDSRGELPTFEKEEKKPRCVKKCVAYAHLPSTQTHTKNILELKSRQR